MKNIKRILIFLIILVILGNITIFAGKSEDHIIKCTGKNGFELYKCEKKEVCNGEDFGESQATKIVTIDKKFEKETNFITAKNIYTFNQNLIYKCGILNSQAKAFIKLKQLLKYTDKTGIVITKILPKINNKLKQLKQLISQNNCKLIEEKSGNKKAVKKIILDQSTLQYCDYRYFLKYLDGLEDNGLEKNFPKNTKVILAKKASEIIIQNKNTIAKEINHIDKMYPIAYETYTQYDSFIKIHILLELLKEDYRTLRDKLYQTLHPINQVVYKIINAQSK